MEKCSWTRRTDCQGSEFLLCAEAAWRGRQPLCVLPKPPIFSLKNSLKLQMTTKKIKGKSSWDFRGDMGTMGSMGMSSKTGQMDSHSGENHWEKGREHKHRDKERLWVRSDSLCLFDPLNGTTAAVFVQSLSAACFQERRTEYLPPFKGKNSSRCFFCFVLFCLWNHFSLPGSCQNMGFLTLKKNRTEMCQIPGNSL